jgi:hypothetical protein
VVDEGDRGAGAADERTRAFADCPQRSIQI